ncbi:HAD family hydrolase [Haloarchaeobius sp. TZWWS8]|uniref:HAD family hydrolase n=1 Tax=Haloarchaeobius sp. TZWWS8 TaxID=3446121 RepID=UPI003EC0F1BD
MSHEAVLFDMDGVLVDSEDYWVEREREEILPWAVPDHEVPVREITGMNYREIHDYLAAEYDVAVSKQEWVDRFDETAETIYTDEVELLPGFRDWLTARRSAGIPVALVSSSPHHWLDTVCERFELEFDAVVSAEDLDGPGKPEPDIYEFAAAKLGLAPEDCVAVEDSEHGVASAAAARTTCVAYRSGADDSLDLSAADFVAETPEELLSLVDELLNVESP